jgi:hypothetical protein
MTDDRPTDPDRYAEWAEVEPIARGLAERWASLLERLKDND